MGIRKDEEYNFSVSARLSENSDINVTAELITSSGQVIGKCELSGFSGDWKNYKARFSA